MTTTQDSPSAVQKVSVLTLTGIVVGSMVGGGVFTLPGEFGERPASSPPWSRGCSPGRGC